MPEQTAPDYGAVMSEAPEDDVAFSGSIPDIYERLLVPLIFAEPADRLADAVAAADPVDVLETAAGTGVLTRALADRLPDASIVATDLNEAIDRKSVV